MKELFGLASGISESNGRNKINNPPPYNIIIHRLDHPPFNNILFVIDL